MPGGSIKVGIVGLGFGRYGLLPAFRADPRCEVVALCSRSAEKVREHCERLGVPRAFGSFEEMLARCRPDAVALAVPPAAQQALAPVALREGVHVLAEKPLALSPDTADRLGRLAAESGRANMIDFLFPEIDEWRTALSILWQEGIGTLRSCVVNWLFQSYDHARGAVTWKTTSETGGGVLSYYSSHVLHYMEVFAGKIASLSAQLSGAQESDTNLWLSLRFENGVHASVAVSCDARLGSGHRLEFFGDRGTLALTTRDATRFDRFTLSLATEDDPELKPVAVPRTRSASDEDSRVAPASRIVRRFLDWVETGEPARPDFRDGARAQHLIGLVEESSRRGVRLAVSA